MPGQPQRLGDRTPGTGDQALRPRAIVPGQGTGSSVTAGQSVVAVVRDCPTVVWRAFCSRSARRRDRGTQGRVPFRSYRTVSRRYPNSHEIDRSIFQRWRPSRSPDSIPGRAIRGIRLRNAEPGHVVGGDVRFVSAYLDWSPSAWSTPGADVCYWQDQWLERLTVVQVRPGRRDGQRVP